MPPATLEVICGPMFAGKTTELIRRASEAQAAGRAVLVAKPVRDTRYAHDALVTHAGGRLPAVPVAALDELLARPADLVAVDEIHFFAAAAMPVIDALLARGTSVAVAGCDIDHFGGIFSPFDLLLPRADRVTRIHGKCARCGAPSTHSERIVPIIDRIIVGGIGDFVATCASCFRPCPRP